MKENLDILSLQNDSKNLEIYFDVTITIPVEPEYSTSSQRNISHAIDINDALNYEYLSDFVTSNALKASPHPLARFDVANIHIKESFNQTESCNSIKIMDDFKIHNLTYSIQ